MSSVKKLASVSFASAFILSLSLTASPTDGYAQDVASAAAPGIVASRKPIGLASAQAPSLNKSTKGSDGSPIPRPRFDLWHFDYDGGFNFQDGNGKPFPMRKNLDIDAKQAWAITSGRPSVVIAILSSGLDTRHPLIRESLYVSTQEIPGNKKDDDRNGYVDDVNGWSVSDKSGDLTDKVSSGTWLAGTISMPGPDLVGLAPQVKLLGVKVSVIENGKQAFSIKNIIAGLDYVLKAKASGVNISVLTLGYIDVDHTAAFDEIKTLTAKLKEVGKAGISIVAPVANANRNLDGLGISPAKIPADGVISAMGVDFISQPAFNTDFGDNSVTIAAPAFVIMTTETSYSGSEFTKLIGWQYYKDKNGTPYPYGNLVSNLAAQGLLAGTAALMYSANPSLTPAEVRDIIVRTAKKPGGLALPAYSTNEQPPKVVAKGFLDTGDATQAAREGAANGIVKFGGNPVSGARIVLRLTSGGKSIELTTTTDAEGRFSFRRPPVGTPFTVQASHPKFDLGGPIGCLNNQLAQFPNFVIERGSTAS